MKTALALLLLALAGLLTGGAVSLHRQGAARAAVVVTALLAALAAAGGILWLWPEDG